MMKIIQIFLICLYTFSLKASEYPMRETRAVWLTTNFALDWPPNTTDENVQKKALKDIFKNLSDKHFNTVYFQVRSNGTVCYNSDIEPFSPYFTGKVGVSPNYDPLEYAIELGKEYNLEVHAWVNTIRCFSGSDESFLKHPKHIRNTFPELTSLVLDENGRFSYWLNPGYFKAQDYLVDLLLELTANYDIDGVQLDFFRYPGENFEDEKFFKEYELNTSLGDWRRNNLTLILRKFKERANPLNPFLKIGITPIGIRKSMDGAIGWEGFYSAFQDTETWLKEKLVDYLVPQIYWNFDENPRFDILADDWVKKSNNRNIVIGLAAYKDDVKPELEDMIIFSRKIGAAGISFFRYSFISKSDEYFDELSFPKNMPWKENAVEISPEFISTELIKKSKDEVMINWEKCKELSLKNLRAYVLLNNDKPIKLFNLSKNKLKLKFVNPSQLAYKYQVVIIDRLWNYNSFSDKLDISVPYLQDLKTSSFSGTEPSFYKINEKEGIISIFSSEDQNVTIDYYNIENIGKQEIQKIKFGLNFIAVSENLKLLKKIKITYNRTNKVEELDII